MATTLTNENQYINFELEPTPWIYRHSWTELAQTTGVGLFVGLLSALLAGPLARYIIEPLLCRNTDAFAFCTQGSSVGFSLALVLLSVAALFVLANIGTYQPLINVVAPLAALWALDTHLPAVAHAYPVVFYGLAALLFAVAYGLFYLLLRFRNFAISLVLVIALIVATRWQL